MSNSLAALRGDLRRLANPEKGKFLQGFFKTGPGEYAEGDIFLGIVVPETRKVARKYKTLPLPQTKELLQSEIHEERLCALLIMVNRFEAVPEEREEIFRCYLANTRWINNWDLVDLSAPSIVGAWLWERDHAPLHRLARSGDLWERRIAILSTFYFIRQGAFTDTLAIAESAAWRQT